MPAQAMALPAGALVVLIGAAGAGKSSFARRHFPATAVLSSDAFRAMLADDEDNQAASADAFALLYQAARMRLRRRRLTVIDATSVRRRARRPLIKLAGELRAPAVAIVFNLSERLCQSRNRRRGRIVPRAVLHRQAEALRTSLAGLREEGFAHVWVLASAAEVNRVSVRFNDLRFRRSGLYSSNHARGSAEL